MIEAGTPGLTQRLLYPAPWLARTLPNVQQGFDSDVYHFHSFPFSVRVLFKMQSSHNAPMVLSMPPFLAFNHLRPVLLKAPAYFNGSSAHFR